MNVIQINLPFSSDDKKQLKTGDKVLLNGTIFTARDAAHKRIIEYLQSGEALPFSLSDAAIFYAGPTPTKPNAVCGAIGPTTSTRMDKYTPALLQAGVKCLIGKGERSAEVQAAIRENDAIYLAAIGGAAALLSQCIVSCEVIALHDLGTEAIHKLVVKDFPAYIIIH